MADENLCGFWVCECLCLFMREREREKGVEWFEKMKERERVWQSLEGGNMCAY